ncbi:MAG: cysteine synthase family protein [Candidatus Desantisbacteria bacterium]|mgnify:CR=1 FL=1
MNTPIRSATLNKIGNTPLLSIKSIDREFKSVRILAKAEWFNPGGSVKDRAGLGMIEDAETRGVLTRDKIILESSSGNTGVALAMIGAEKGYQVELIVPENVHEVKREKMEYYGARLILTPAIEGSDGASVEAERRYKENPEAYFFVNQYNNPANPQAHYETTGLEILKQTDFKITHFVAGSGTGGTLMGAGRRLKEYDPGIQVIGVQPKEALHGIEGLKNMDSSMVPGNYKDEFPDRKIFVATEDAYQMQDMLDKEEGLQVGTSAGAAMWAAFELARYLSEGIIVTVFPDGYGGK